MKTEYPKLPGLKLTARTIYCIGRNYAEHAKELGNAVPTEPVVFLKPLSSIIYSGDAVRLPKQSSRVDHEVEIVVALGAGGRDLSEAQALASIAGYAVGLDITARDLQDAAKKKALPWAVAKGFDTFTALGKFARASAVTSITGLEFELLVNGSRRQHGKSSDMIFSIPRLIAYLSTVFTLAAGDLIFTGTPEGVAPLKAGDRVEARLRELSKLELTVERG